MAEPKGGLAFIPETTSEAVQANKAYQDALNRLNSALEARQNRMFDPTMLALAEGFLTPGRTGSFGEALGTAAGKMRAAEEVESKQEQEIAQAKMGIAQQQMQLAQQQQRQKAIQGMLTSGAQDFTPQQILAMSQTDPATAKLMLDIAGKLPEIDKAKRDKALADVSPRLFTLTSDNKVELNPKAYSDYIAIAGPAGAEQIAKTLTANRSAGIMANLPREGATPFDAAIIFAKELPGSGGEAWSNQAQQLARQYLRGDITEDKANQLAKDLMQGIQSSLDKKEARASSELFKSLGLEIARGNQQLREERLRADLADQERRLSDEQKNILRTYVNPIVQEGIKGQGALMTVQSLRDIIERAPSGTMSGLFATSVGALFGTDENTALRRLETASKSLIPQIPRLPGAASNLDAQNLEASIGKLTDVKLTNQQRRELVNDIYTRFKTLVDRADRVNDYWQSNKSFDVKLLESKPDQTPVVGQGKVMPTGDRLKGYADMHFGGNQQQAVKFLQSQGYR